MARDFPALADSAAYWTARCDLLDSHYDVAKKKLERLAGTRTPEIAEIQFDLAYCELMLGHDAAALQQLEAFRKTYPYSSHLFEALYYEATALHRQGDYQKSVEFCDAAADPRSPVARQAQLLKGENLLMLAQYDKADEIFAALEKKPAGEVERLRLALRRGQCAYFARDYKAAETRLEPVAKSAHAARDPVLQEAAFLLGDAQLQQREYAAAAETLSGYLANARERRDEAGVKLALAQIGSKDPAAGVATLRDVMAGDMKAAWVQRAWLEYAQEVYRQAHRDDAQSALQTLLAAAPAESIAAPAQYLFARIDMDAGQSAAAAGRLANLAKTYPNNPLAEDAVFVRGLCLQQGKEPAEAQAQFAAYVKNYPAGKHVAEALHQAALCMAAQGKTADAVKALAGLAGRAETRTDGVLYDLAWAYRSAGDNAQRTRFTVRC